MHDFDIIVIGAGPGGYPAAIRAAQLGNRTALIEREALGGACLNWGCIPTKTLIASAERYHQACHAQDLGVCATGVSYDYGRMAARKNAAVSRLGAGIRALIESHGIELVRGAARFEGPDRLSVLQPDGATRWLRARVVIIAAGNNPVLPSFLPRDKRIVDSRAFLDRDTLPESLLILGGGVIGCEFACLAAALGVKVAIVELLDDIITALDRDVRRVLRKRMAALGIAVHTGAPLSEVAIQNDRVTGVCGNQTVSGDLLLVAVGRRPATSDLHLDRAGIKTDADGAIPVDNQGRTCAPSIFAIGDLTCGSIQLAHAATQQGITAAEAASGQRSRVDPLCPACIFTSPEIGMVGLTESAAQQAGRPVITAHFPFSALGKALALGSSDGFVKWIADAQTGQLLGAQAIGCHATELIAEATLAVRNELTLAEVGHTIHCHPTLSEAWMEAAHAGEGACIHLPKR